MKNLQKLLIIFIAVITFSVSLASCGRYSEPSPVAGSGFPHHYPKD